MATKEESVNNLIINILSKDKYDTEEINSSEIYVVKQDESDTDNAIASRTYADVGRDAVIISEEEPDIEKSKLWINPNDVNPDDIVYISPADTDLQNITEKATTKLENITVPNYDSGVNITEITGDIWTASENGYIYINIGYNSYICIKYKTSTGPTLISLQSGDSDKTSTILPVGNGQQLYIDDRDGSVEMMFFPFKGAINE